MVFAADGDHPDAQSHMLIKNIEMSIMSKQPVAVLEESVKNRIDLSKGTNILPDIQNSLQPQSENIK